MGISLRALLTCLSFYTGAYLVYYFFSNTQQAGFLIIGVALIILTWFLTPYPHERGRQGYTDTMTFGLFFYNPLIFWYRFFSWPIRILLALWASN